MPGVKLQKCWSAGHTFGFAGLQHTALVKGWSWRLESSLAGADLACSRHPAEAAGGGCLAYPARGWDLPRRHQRETRGGSPDGASAE